jgi:transcriptional regulator with GAF, ATPase, and Fis domain
MNTPTRAQRPKKSDGLLTLLFEHADCAVFLIDPVSRSILKANQKGIALLGSTTGEVVGMNLDRVLPGPGGLAVDLECHQVEHEGRSAAVVIAQPIEFYARRDNGSLSQLTPDCDDLIETALEFPAIVGQSQQIRKVCSLIGLVSKTDTTVLIQGESGTGKELIAQAIHFHSRRAHGPLIKVNCAALTETLLESELFGHRKGSFTGAIQDRKGRFKLADGGTIILDEIGSMSLAGQAKLLRVLQEREFEPVGESQTVKVNVRVMAITNADLITAIHEGRFREDLYYRLNAFPIYLPPLRERKVDISLLARHFLKECQTALKKEIEDLELPAVQMLMDYGWSGNIRELKNAVEYAVIMENGKMLRTSSFPDKLRHDNSRRRSLKDRVESAERQIILEALSGANGIKSRAARLLGIDRRNFSYFLHKHGIP